MNNKILLVLVGLLLSSQMIYAGEIFSEDFTVNPGWPSTEPTNVKWDPAGFYRARVTDNPSGFVQWGSSPVFEEISNRSFSLEFDINPVNPSWGTYPLLGLVPEGVPHPFDDIPLSIGAERADEFPNNFVMRGKPYGSSSPIYFSSPVFAVGEWYHQRVDYDAASNTLTWKISLVGMPDGSFYSIAYTNISVAPFNQVVVGYESTPPVYGSWAEIYVDNIVVSVSELAGEGCYDFVTTWGSYGSGDGQFRYPQCIATDSSGYVYVTDYWNHRVQKFTSDGTFVTTWGSHGSGDGQFNDPVGITIDPSGYVYVCDAWNHRIQKFESDGTFVDKWGSFGSGDGQFNTPFDIAVDSAGYIYVTDRENHRVQKFEPNEMTGSYDFVTKWGSQGSGNGQFNGSLDIATDSAGYVYVVDRNNHRVQKFEPNEMTGSYDFVTTWGSLGNGDGQFDHPLGIVIDSADYIYVADEYNDRIQKFDQNGNFLGWLGRDDLGYTGWHEPGSGRVGVSGAGDGQFDKPFGITIGSSGSVYVVDAQNQRVQKFAPCPEPAEPNIAVSPLSHDFGDVELGTSSTVIVTISNEGSGDLTVSGIALETDFAITSVPPASIVVEPSETVDVEITYTPTVLGYNLAVLKITSDDPDEPVVEVQLSAAGVEIPPPPSEQIANILSFFDTSVDDGSLVGDGPGSSAEKRLNALRNMIEAAGDLIDNELLEEACQQLLDVYGRMDGQPKPPDFVTGEAVPELATMLQDLMTTLGCE